MHRIQFQLGLRPADPHFGKLHTLAGLQLHAEEGKGREKEGCKSIHYFLANSDTNGFDVTYCCVVYCCFCMVSKVGYSIVGFIMILCAYEGDC